MPRREDLYLGDLVETANAISMYLGGISREEWEQNEILRNAVLYKMLILGEIARALPDELKARYPEVPWPRIKGFRNIATHQYFGVDWAIIWKIAHDDVPDLGQQGLDILRQEFPDVAKQYDSHIEVPEDAPSAGTE